MSLRSPAAWVAMLLLVVLSEPGRAAGFVDSAERYVNVPDHPRRVMPANQSAAVLVFVLARDKLAGWSRAPSRGRRSFLPAKYARLRAFGSLNRSNPAAAVPLIARTHPDLIIESGPVTSEAAARADWYQQRTGVPYIVLDNSIQTIPAMLRSVGAMLGAAQRGEDLASRAEYVIGSVRGRLLIAPADERPLVYYGRGADGLRSAPAGSQAIAAIEQAGAINVAANVGTGEANTVTRSQIRAWKPGIIIAEDRRFYNSLRRGFQWRGLPAVTNKRLYLAPSDPFGWLDGPPGVNRLIGLSWLTGLFYPDQSQEDLRADVRQFYEQFYGVKLTDRQLEGLVRTAEAQAGESRRSTNVPLLGAQPVPFPSPNAPAAPGGAPAPPGRGGPGAAPGLPNLPAAPGRQR
ncbi:MAG: ABC transporter substrate-binding protein [Alphaproteobacteria bacterium]|nr:ABC transporter substrate-binding protein [Alphaproteobacteria bacterium]